jgi:DNA-binding response OmpR family regulator
MITSPLILIVDDEIGVRFFLEELLTQDGYQVVTADSAEAALALGATQEFDLALVDLNLPGMSGLELIAALHRQQPDLVIIVLTAYASLDTAVEALRQGAHDYLFKPSKAGELRASVQSGLLKRRQQSRQKDVLTQLAQQLLANLRTDTPQPIAPALTPDVDPPEAADRFLKRGGLLIDLMRHALTVNGQLIDLSLTEFALVTHLASIYPQVIAPQALLRAVQGHEVSPLEASEALRYHVHRIRQKTKQATDQVDIIRTVRGVGYTLADL